MKAKSTVKDKEVKSNFESVSIINPVSKELELSDIYTPIGDQLVVEARIFTETEAGIKIPDHLQEKEYVVKVIAVGSKVTETKKGDLLYCQFTGNTPAIPLINKRGYEYIQIKEYQILGIVASNYKVLTALKSSK